MFKHDRWLTTLILLLSLPVVLGAQSSPPAATTLLLEAEDFKPAKGSAWKPVKAGAGNYYFATLANTFISRQKLLSAPEQCERSEATMTVDIPADGTYRVWTRYELPSRWRVEHTLKVEQDGGVALNRIYGKIDSPKLWPFGKGITSMVDWDWGSGDNVVWEFSDPVVLSKGKATFALIADKQEGELLPTCRGAAKRNVDCVFLTADLDDGIRDAKEAFYHRFDKHLNQRGDLWMRVTNPKVARTDSLRCGNALLWVALDVKEHNPYWQKRNPAPRIGARGEIKGEPTDADWIEPGKSSPWVAIGHALDTTNWQELIVDVKYGRMGERAYGRDNVHTPIRQHVHAGLYLTVEFARDAKGKRLICRKTVKHDELNRVVFEVPADVRAAKDIKTLEEMHRDLLAYLKRLRRRGRVPQHVPVYGIMGGNWHGKAVKTPDEFYRLRTETGLLLGRNTWKKDEIPPDLQTRHTPHATRNLMIDVRGVPTPQLEQYLRERKAKGELDQVLIVSMGDEIHVGGYNPDDPQDQQAFGEYLTRLRAMDANTRRREYAIHTDVPDPATANLTSDLTDGRNFYWSHLFSIDRGIDQLKERTAIVEKVLGKGVYTGANYSPHPQYWPKVGQWVRLFRRRGMTMPWTEDWTFQVAELSPQVIAYLMDVFRCAAKYYDLPIHCYTMPHYPGQTPRDLTLSFYSALAHGNKVINFFAAVPPYDYTENYIAWEGLENWKAVRDLVHDVGMADDIIWNGKVRPAQVAILLSHTTDLYEEARGSSIYNFERKNLYYALRHAQVPVDFLTEEDVAEGWLDGIVGADSYRRPSGKGFPSYKVLYVCGDHMLRACAEKIREWVKNGGHLFSVAGGGFLDEYNQPLDVLKEVYGVEDQKLTLTEKNLWVKEGLGWVERLDLISSGGLVKDASGVSVFVTVHTHAALIARQDFVTSSDNYFGIFEDGKPAAVSNGYGKGRAELFGTFPGSAYIKHAIPKRPYDRGSAESNFNHFLPTEFNSYAVMMVWPFFEELEMPLDFWQFHRYLVDPIIDATVIEAPQGVVVPMANYSDKPIEELTVTIRDVPHFQHIYSVRRGALKYQRQGSDVTVTLPLEWADMVVIRK